MTIERDLLELLESTATVAEFGSAARDGKVTGGTAHAIQCHVERKRRKVVNAAGDSATAEGTVALDDAYLWITEGCRLTLPDGVAPPIVAVETTYGPNLDTGLSGPYQTIIYFGA